MSSQANLFKRSAPQSDLVLTDADCQALCYCLTCRRLTGSAFTVTFAVPKDLYRFTAGSPKIYSTKQDSGMKLTYSFCGSCGSTVAKAGDGESLKDIVLVQAGSLDNIKEIGNADPNVEFYVSRRVPWLSALEGKGRMWEFT